VQLQQELEPVLELQQGLKLGRVQAREQVLLL
jgi:hypothetical protein